MMCSLCRTSSATIGNVGLVCPWAGRPKKMAVAIAQNSMFPCSETEGCWGAACTFQSKMLSPYRSVFPLCLQVACQDQSQDTLPAWTKEDTDAVNWYL